MTGLTKLYIDMDDVLADFSTAFYEKRTKDIQYPQATHGFFADLEPLEGAIEAFNYLFLRYDVWIATAPSVKNPMCYTEKRMWVEKHLGMAAVDKLIIIPNKALLKGALLIDDNLTGRGQESFEGYLVYFTGDWAETLQEVQEVLPV